MNFSQTLRVCTFVYCLLYAVCCSVIVIDIAMLPLADILRLGTLAVSGGKVGNASRRFSCALESFPGDFHPLHIHHILLQWQATQATRVNRNMNHAPLPAIAHKNG